MVTGSGPRAVRRRTSLADWTAGGSTLVYRGHEIFVREAGDSEGEPLLLIHGFPTASWDWEALWPALVKQFRVLTLDMIGFGTSAKPSAYEYTLVDQADLFEHFLKDRCVPRYHVLAHDYGDSVAQELLARQRDPGERPRLASVAFLNGGLFPETHRPVFVQRLLLSPFGPLVSKLFNRATLGKNMHAVFGPDTKPDGALIDDFFSLIRTNRGQAIMHKLIRYMPERRRHRERWVDALRTASIPLKVIDGALDPVSGAHMVARYRELVPKPDVTMLPRIGHYPQVEAPDAVLAAYLEFRAGLEKHEKRPT